MINRTILNYRIINEIGKGGMATVYEAEHIKLTNKHIAIKILDPVLSGNKSVRERFKNEANIMADLNNEHIMQVLDFDDEDGILAIFMEKLEGMDLSDYITKNGALLPEKAIGMMKQILNAFAYAHHRKIVHRDVKPSNIFIETKKNENIKILDFGIAKLLENNSEMTQTGMFMGTPLYMSPEQADDSKHIDHRSDIYSLGVTFYFMLSGKPPYDSSTLSSRQISNKVAEEPLPELIGMPELNQIIKNATAKNINDRYQSCEEFVFNLDNYLDNSKLNSTKSEEETVKKEEKIPEKKLEIINSNQPKPASFYQNKIDTKQNFMSKPNNKEVFNPLFNPPRTKKRWFIIPLIILVIIFLALVALAIISEINKNSNYPDYTAYSEPAIEEVVSEEITEEAITNELVAEQELTQETENYTFNEPDIVTQKFLESLGNQNCTDAYKLQSNKAWGNVSEFCKKFSSIENIQILEITIEDKTTKNANVLVDIVILDKTSKLGELTRYQQRYSLVKNTNEWKITKFKVLSSAAY